MDYKNYMGKAAFEKSLNTLIGIISGIKANQIINYSEVQELQKWCQLQNELRFTYPFSELLPKVYSSIEDGIMSEEEIEDILWSCNMYINKNPYFDVITSDIQTLQGILHGIMSDNKIDAKELNYLRNWLKENDHLESVYPYDEVYSLLHKVMQDGKIDENEERLLKAFFADFIDASSSYNINLGEIDQIKKEMNIHGICALGPNIEIEDKVFCFTGESVKMKRSEIEAIIVSRGGRFNNNVIKETNYLVVGDAGNPYWAFSCYGRKVEKAISLRKKGVPVVIVHEIDFWDALN